MPSPLTPIRKAAPAMARQVNRAAALKIVRERGPISRAEVAAITGLAKNSVSSIFEALHDEGLICSDGLASASSKGGRRRELWRINPDAGRIIGLDLERSKVEAAVMDFAGRVLHKRSRKPSGKAGKQAILSATLSVIDALLQHDATQQAKLLGIGVATFGRLSPDKALANCYGLVPGWDDVPLKRIIEDHTGAPTTLETNLVASAMAEQWFGSARDVSDFAVLLFRTGIGVGLCANGTILDGSTGRAGELGHITVDEHGPPCACGSHGCLEAVASRAALADRLARAAKRRAKSMLLQQASPKSVTLDAVIDAAAAGDALARKLLAETAQHVGVALANVMCLTDPELVVIGPALSRGRDMIVDLIRDEIALRMPGASDRALRIRTSPLGDDLVLLGAGALVIAKVREKRSDDG